MRPKTFLPLQFEKERDLSLRGTSYYVGFTLSDRELQHCGMTQDEFQSRMIAVVSRIFNGSEYQVINSYTIPVESLTATTPLGAPMVQSEAPGTGLIT